uniref:DNA-(apurinic or apyrimidinic site) lyase n=1 Tax=Phallusia mammillata TaxID=59560 RepID=A0A6F9DM97_9ASCI|nr:N-glycosylase/DNA lyase-like [Phallusia mammillata]
MNKISCRNKQFQLKLNLTCGQSFRWRCVDENLLIGVFSHRVWLLYQKEHCINYKVLACPHWSATSSNLPGKRKQSLTINDIRSLSSLSGHLNKLSHRKCNCGEAEQALLEDYLQINVCWSDLLSEWILKDKRFLKTGNSSQGIHVLRQDPVETLISFLCSVNNSIYRIVPLVEKLCNQFGDKLFECEGKMLHDFPDLQTLSRDENIPKLRNLGFGYRAEFIVKCAKKVLNNGGEKWMMSLRSDNYETASEKLVQLPGVGHKVADCVCLMALDKPEAVPVDTHVRQIANRDYAYKVAAKSLTPNAYRQIGKFLYN